MKYLNVPDLALIAIAAFAVIWAINGAMRHLNVPEFQA